MWQAELCFLLGLFCDREDVGDVFLRNIGKFSTYCTTLCLHNHRYENTDYKIKINYMDLIRKKTIPTERPPHVGEVTAQFCG
jgi:hypothetical protein